MHEWYEDVKPYCMKKKMEGLAKEVQNIKRDFGDVFRYFEVGLKKVIKLAK